MKFLLLKKKFVTKFLLICLREVCKQNSSRHKLEYHCNVINSRQTAKV